MIMLYYITTSSDVEHFKDACEWVRNAFVMLGGSGIGPGLTAVINSH